MVVTSLEEVPEFAEELELELFADERLSSVLVEERGDMMLSDLSVLRPSGFLLLFTVSRGLSRR